MMQRRLHYAWVQTCAQVDIVIDHCLVIAATLSVHYALSSQVIGIHATQWTFLAVKFAV